MVVEIDKDMKCLSCGNMINENDNFCSKCGNPVYLNKVVQNNQKKMILYDKMIDRLSELQLDKGNCRESTSDMMIKNSTRVLFYAYKQSKNIEYDVDGLQELIQDMITSTDVDWEMVNKMYEKVDYEVEKRKKNGW